MCNDRISLFTTDGQFVRCISHVHGGEFNGPYGIAVDTLGNLYIGDSVNGRVVVL